MEGIDKDPLPGETGEEIDKETHNKLVEVCLKDPFDPKQLVSFISNSFRGIFIESARVKGNTIQEEFGNQHTKRSNEVEIEEFVRLRFTWFHDPKLAAALYHLARKKLFYVAQYDGPITDEDGYFRKSRPRHKWLEMAPFSAQTEAEDRKQWTPIEVICLRHPYRQENLKAFLMRSAGMSPEHATQSAVIIEHYCSVTPKERDPLESLMNQLLPWVGNQLEHPRNLSLSLERLASADVIFLDRYRRPLEGADGYIVIADGPQFLNLDPKRLVTHIQKYRDESALEHFRPIVAPSTRQLLEQAV